MPEIHHEDISISAAKPALSTRKCMRIISVMEGGNNINISTYAACSCEKKGMLIFAAAYSYPMVLNPRRLTCR